MAKKKFFRWFKFIAWRTTMSERSSGAGRTKRKKLNFAIRRKKETRATFIVNEDLLENEIIGLLG
jgi:hypothetical protein